MTFDPAANIAKGYMMTGMTYTKVIVAGTSFQGFFASPAVIATRSVPKENMASVIEVLCIQ